MPYIPHTNEELQEMLKVVNVRTLDDLFADITPEMKPQSYELPNGKSEEKTCKYFEELASLNNTNLTSFLGAGFYNHFIPKAVDTLSSRGEFVTAYTPYQPEVSQGTLQGIFEFQSSISRLLDMECVNASVYDGGSALFESITMSIRHTGKRRIVVDSAISPIWLKMIYSYTANLKLEIVEVEQSKGVTQVEALKNAIDENTASVIVQNPNFFGNIYDFTDLFNHAHEKKALGIIAIQPMMQSLLKTPGEMGADIAVADGQVLGLPLSFGGPYLGLMSCKKSLVRQLPGRIVGKTKDVDGKDGYVLTLQAREQHIRRAKATSNICSNQALCAMRALIYMCVVGAEGMERTALLSIENTRYAIERLSAIEGVSVLNSENSFGYEVAIELPKNASEVINALSHKGFVAGFPVGSYYKDMDNVLLFCCTEKHTKEDIDLFVEMLQSTLSN